MNESGMTIDVLLLRLLLAAVVGAVLGYARRERGEPKAIGSATSMLFAKYQAITDPSAPGRVIQSVLQGIGFLAGAVIFKGGTDVQGIKTATTIWITSALGLATGSGLWWLAVIVGGATALILVVTDLTSGGGRQAEDGAAPAERSRGQAPT